MRNFENVDENLEQRDTESDITSRFDTDLLEKYDKMMGDDIFNVKLEEPGVSSEKTLTSHETNLEKKYDKLIDNDDMEKSESDVNENYYSTYEERIKQTPREDSERGGYEGDRGESKFIPTDKEINEILEKYGLDGIVYKDGIPDFSEVSESTVEIDNMTDNRADNFSQCDEKCAEQWNKEGKFGKSDWTARDVANWRKENGYSWHERNDMKTCDLVPTKINDYFGHLGGVSECKKRDSENNAGGSDFDD